MPSDTEDPSKAPPVNSPGTNDTDTPKDGAAISAPQAAPDGQLKLEQRSVRDVAQALSICTTAESRNRARAWRNKAVQDLADMAPPRSFGDKLQQGKGWQTNISTGALSGLVQRVVYRFVQNINTAQTLTHSTLPETIPGWKAKTDILAAKMTELARDWVGFTPFVNQVAVENVLQGYCLPLWLSPTDWKPVFFKQERCLVPEGTKMDVKEVQWIVGKIDYPVSDFVQLFTDEEAAAKSGYDIKNCERAATHAVVAQQGDDYLTTEPRRFTEMLVQGTYGATWGNGGQRCVKCYIFANMEYDGQVSFWLLSREGGANTALLRYVFKAFPSMDKFSGLLAFEPGDGTVHSSKGVGRRLFNLCSALELARCQMIDSAFLSNLLIMSADAPARNKGVMTVLSPFMVVPSEVKLLAEKFPVTPKDLAAADQLFTAWMQQGIGAYISDVVDPSDDSKGDQTATAKKIDFAREQESAAQALARWEDQMYGSVFWNMQQRAFSEANLKRAKGMFMKIVADTTERANRPSLYETKGDDNDPALMRKLVEVLMQWPDTLPKGVSLSDWLDGCIDEIGIWRDTPSTIKANIIKTVQANAVAQILAKYAATPLAVNLDLAAMQQFDVESVLGPQLAKKFWIPQGDSTAETEAARQQLEEISTMLSLGLPLPVSPRDNHIVHATICQQWLTQKAAPVLSTPQADDTSLKQAADVLNHMGAHLQAASLTLDSKKPGFADLEKFFAGFSQQLQQVVEIHAHAQQAAIVAHQQISLANGAASPTLPQQTATIQPAPSPAPAEPPPVTPPANIPEPTAAP